MLKEQIENSPTPEQIKHLLQESILRDYPNPERKGCLDSPITMVIAQQRLPYKESGWAHISHCSPCYREFLDFRKQFRENKIREDQLRRRKRMAFIVTVVVLGLSAIVMLKIH